MFFIKFKNNHAPIFGVNAERFARILNGKTIEYNRYGNLLDEYFVLSIFKRLNPKDRARITQLQAYLPVVFCSKRLKNSEDENSQEMEFGETTIFLVKPHPVVGLKYMDEIKQDLLTVNNVLAVFTYRDPGSYNDFLAIATHIGSSQSLGEFQARWDFMAAFLYKAKLIQVENITRDPDMVLLLPPNAECMYTPEPFIYDIEVKQYEKTIGQKRLLKTDEERQMPDYAVSSKIGSVFNQPRARLLEPYIKWLEEKRVPLIKDQKTLCNVAFILGGNFKSAGVYYFLRIAKLCSFCKDKNLETVYNDYWPKANPRNINDLINLIKNAGANF